MISYVRRVGGSTPSEGAKLPDASTFFKNEIRVWICTASWWHSDMISMLLLQLYCWPALGTYIVWLHSAELASMVQFWSLGLVHLQIYIFFQCLFFFFLFLFFLAEKLYGQLCHIGRSGSNGLPFIYLLNKILIPKTESKFWEWACT